MKLPVRSKHKKIEIDDYYKVRVGTLWKGLKQEHICFWALCAYFFFEYVRPQTIYPAIKIIPWSQITLIVALVSVYFDRSIKWVSSIENKLLILFFIIIIISGFYAFKPSASWEKLILIINWMLLYFLVINIVNSERRLIIFILAYLLYSFKMSQFGFFVMAGRGFAFADWGIIGAGGFFQNSGEFAIQMVIFGCLSLSFVLALRNNWGIFKKWFFYFMPFSAFVSVVGASSRGSQLALAVIILMALVKFKGGLKPIILLSIFAIVLVNFLPEEQLQRFSNIGKDNTSLQRLAYWEYGIKITNENPFLGIGYYNWLDYIQFIRPESFVKFSEEPHNIFIKVGTELGYTGLLCFLLMILFNFIINARTRRTAKKLENRLIHYLAYGLDAGLVGYLVAGMFVTVVYYPFFWVQMAMTVALHSISINRFNELKKKTPKLYQAP